MFHVCALAVYVYPRVFAPQCFRGSKAEGTRVFSTPDVFPGERCYPITNLANELFLFVSAVYASPSDLCEREQLSKPCAMKNISCLSCFSWLVNFSLSACAGTNCVPRVRPCGLCIPEQSEWYERSMREGKVIETMRPFLELVEEREYPPMWLKIGRGNSRIAPKKGEVHEVPE